jgi:hypothetical protein
MASDLARLGTDAYQAHTLIGSFLESYILVVVITPIL